MEISFSVYCGVHYKQISIAFLSQSHNKTAKYNTILRKHNNGNWKK